MAPRKRGSKPTKRASSKKKAKGDLPSIPDDVVEHIFSFLPIKKAVNSGVVSTRFKDSWLLSRILDFGSRFGEKNGQSNSVEIINKAFDRHRGTQIRAFSLDIDPTGIMLFVENWIRISIEKGVEDLQLDFIQGDTLAVLPIDLSAVETLRILKLRYCAFQTPKPLKGLKFLHTLYLNRTNVTSDTLDSVFRNCCHLNTFGLIGCPSVWELMLTARNQKKFQTLIVACCPNLTWIGLDAPTLETFYYCGLVRRFQFVDVCNLKDVMLDFVQSRELLRTLGVNPIAFDLCHISVLTVTNVFLEGLSKRMVEGEFIEVPCMYEHLEEFQLIMESTSYLSLFDIANFVKNCPSLQRLYLDLKNFSFESGMYWEAHQRQPVEEFPYKLNSLKLLEIKGFQGNRYEMDIARFFLRKSPCLETLVVVNNKKTNNNKMSFADYGKIYNLEGLKPSIEIFVFENSCYRSKFPPKHSRKWF